MKKTYNINSKEYEIIFDSIEYSKSFSKDNTPSFFGVENRQILILKDNEEPDSRRKEKLVSVFYQQKTPKIEIIEEGPENSFFNFPGKNQILDKYFLSKNNGLKQISIYSKQNNISYHFYKSDIKNKTIEYDENKIYYLKSKGISIPIFFELNTDIDENNRYSIKKENCPFEFNEFNLKNNISPTGEFENNSLNKLVELKINFSNLSLNRTTMNSETQVKYTSKNSFLIEKIEINGIYLKSIQQELIKDFVIRMKPTVFNIAKKDDIGIKELKYNFEIEYNNRITFINQEHNFIFDTIPENIKIFNKFKKYRIEGFELLPNFKNKENKSIPLVLSNTFMFSTNNVSIGKEKQNDSDYDILTINDNIREEQILNYSKKETIEKLKDNKESIFDFNNGGLFVKRDLNSKTNEYISVIYKLEIDKYGNLDYICFDNIQKGLIEEIKKKSKFDMNF